MTLMQKLVKKNECGLSKTLPFSYTIKNPMYSITVVLALGFGSGKVVVTKAFIKLLHRVP